MAESFSFDVFLSHSAKDKAVGRPLAEWLRSDALKVWFDEWELPVAASRQSAAFSAEGRAREEDGGALPRRRYAEKIEEGLEHSRVLVLCVSANAFGSGWAQLACPAAASARRWKAGACRFLYPLNKERRFIPLRRLRGTV